MQVWSTTTNFHSIASNVTMKKWTVNINQSSMTYNTSFNY